MLMFGNVLVIGTGLMGGSLAKALREKQLAIVEGYARRKAPLETGVRLGILDAVVEDLPTAIAKADLIVLGVPTLAVGQYFPLIEKHRKTDCVVTDVASVKGDVIVAIERVLGYVPEWFVPGHPIAGAELSGIEASDSALYVRHKVVLTPLENTDADALAKTQALWQAVGADVVAMSVTTHDEVLAATSHLPHVLAFALVDTLLALPKEYDVFDFAAGGFRDFSRIASSDPTMWHDIMLANKQAILQMIVNYQQHLTQFATLIAQEDSAALLQLFTRAKTARDDFTVRLHERQKGNHE